MNRAGRWHLRLRRTFLLGWVGVWLLIVAAPAWSIVIETTGKQRITGFSRGGTFQKIPSAEVGGAFRQVSQDAPEALDRQRIPPEAADLAKGYFNKLGGQSPK